MGYSLGYSGAYGVKVVDPILDFFEVYWTSIPESLVHHQDAGKQDFVVKSIPRTKIRATASSRVRKHWKSMSLQSARGDSSSDTAVSTQESSKQSIRGSDTFDFSIHWM